MPETDAGALDDADNTKEEVNGREPVRAQTVLVYICLNYPRVCGKHRAKKKGWGKLPREGEE